jgi:hypothetical protein
MRHNTCEECGHYNWTHDAQGCHVYVKGEETTATFRYAIQQRGQPSAAYQSGSLLEITSRKCACTQTS